MTFISLFLSGALTRAAATVIFAQDEKGESKTGPAAPATANSPCVPQPKLHDTRVPLDRVEIPEGRSGPVQVRIDPNS